MYAKPQSKTQVTVAETNTETSTLKEAYNLK
jgi:hypothetical protein